VGKTQVARVVIVEGRNLYEKRNVSHDFFAIILSYQEEVCVVGLIAGRDYVLQESTRRIGIDPHSTYIDVMVCGVDKSGE